MAFARPHLRRRLTEVLQVRTALGIAVQSLGDLVPFTGGLLKCVGRRLVTPQGNINCCGKLTQILIHTGNSRQHQTVVSAESRFNDSANF